MKKRILIISFVVLIALLTVVGIFALKNTDRSFLSQEKDVSEQASLEKAKDLSNAVVLTEGKDIKVPEDISDVKANKSLIKTVNTVSNSIFDTVIVNLDLFTKVTEKSDLSAEKLEKIANFLKLFSEKGLKVYLTVSLKQSNKFIAELCRGDFFDGIVLQSDKSLTAKKINDRLPKLVNKIKKQKNKKSVLLNFAGKTENLSQLKLESIGVERLLLNIPAKKDITAFFAILESISNGKTPVQVVFPVSACGKNDIQPSWLLQQVMRVDKYIGARCFDSFKSIKKDFGSCFSAVKEYITNGIKLTDAFSGLVIEDYDGSTVRTAEDIATVNISGSYLYPVNLGKKEIMLSENGLAQVDLSLNYGENKFTFTQNGAKAEYIVYRTFDGEVISSIEPADIITAQQGQTISIKVTAPDNAKVTLRAGMKDYNAKRGKKTDSGLYVYTAKIKMPSDRLQIESIGKISVMATVADKVVAKDGPMVVYSEKSNPSTTNVATTQQYFTLPANNAIPTVQTETTTAFVPQNSLSIPPEITGFSTPAQVTSPNGSSQYNGQQMCVISVDSADTWPSGDGDKFVPYYAPLIKGTYDYVTGQSEAYDSDEGKTRTFYQLGSGRKVQQKCVNLIETANFGDNQMSVIESNANNGNLTITLSSKWKVPYNVTFSPQQYYAAKGKLYNVSSFTANVIQFTFYYTTAADGQVNSAGSDVISQAYWQFDTQKKTATLTMPLKTQGRFYGYSIEYDQNGNTVITINNKPSTLSGSVIVLDPGHGGKDNGAPGYGNMAYEADINFSVAVMTKNELEKRGAKVYLTRYDDRYVSLEERKAFARSVKADVFVSIHSDAAEDDSAYGTSVYYYKPMSQPLSNSIYNCMVQAYCSYIYPNDSARQSHIQRGSNFNPFSVTRLEECPSVLVEMGYVSNEFECSRLVDEQCRQKISEAIAQGIENYITSQK